MSKTTRSLQNAYHSLLPEPARNKLFQYMPDVVKKKINNLDLQIKDLPPSTRDLALPRDPIGPSRFPRRVNKLCGEADWQGEEWLSLFDELGESHIRENKHRKAWEWVQGVYALQHLNLLRNDATAIGVGAGVESVLFYLANQLKMVIATDIYGEGDFAVDAAPAEMLTEPALYAKFPYRQDHLKVMYMDGLHLEFPDNLFDFAFSFSSIEHFGGHAASAQAVKEMGRVVKPGGAVVLTTEVVLNGIEDEEFFLPQEIDQYLIPGNNLRPIEDIDYSITETTMAGYVNTANPDFIQQLPHLVLKRGPIYYTSVCLVLEKLETN